MSIPLPSLTDSRVVALLRRLHHAQSRAGLLVTKTRNTDLNSGIVPTLALARVLVQLEEEGK